MEQWEVCEIKQHVKDTMIDTPGEVRVKIITTLLYAEAEGPYGSYVFCGPDVIQVEEIDTYNPHAEYHGVDTVTRQTVGDDPNEIQRRYTKRILLEGWQPAGENLWRRVVSYAALPSVITPWYIINEFENKDHPSEGSWNLAPLAIRTPIVRSQFDNSAPNPLNMFGMSNKDMNVVGIIIGILVILYLLLGGSR